MGLGYARKCSPVCDAARMTFCLRISWLYFRMISLCGCKALMGDICVSDGSIPRILLRELARHAHRGKRVRDRIGGSLSRLSQHKSCSPRVAVSHSGSSHLLPGDPVVWIANRSGRWEGWIVRLPLYFLGTTGRGHSSSPFFLSHCLLPVTLPACIAIRIPCDSLYATSSLSNGVLKSIGI